MSTDIFTRENLTVTRYAGPQCNFGHGRKMFQFTVDGKMANLTLIEVLELAKVLEHELEPEVYE